MKTNVYDAVVIGGGAAGMACACEMDSSGLKVAIVEREETLGGILLQCIHNGFGLHRFKEELTGPEYAERYIEKVENTSLDVFLSTTVVNIANEGEGYCVTGYSGSEGVLLFKTEAVVLAMGCRERNRGNIGIPGTRPSGILTAGLAQRLINMDGLVPGRRIVIAGSGDIGLIMARRLTWTGCEVLGVVEILPYASGITRNIVQCLKDFDIPLYLSHIISRIEGKDRVESVQVTPLQDGKPDISGSFPLECDTILLSVGLIPENELSRKASVKINHETGGAYVDAHYMTSQKGIFACGNVLHVHDIVDFVSEESVTCGRYVHQYVKHSLLDAAQYNVTPGANVKYVIPNSFIREAGRKFYLRSLIVKNDAELKVMLGEQTIIKKKLRHVQPSEMISFVLDNEAFPASLPIGDRMALEVSIH
ncbi:MAG: FAD-dependent oxidoreductase [Spirochaetales bacterium]|nr:FAD-dependent oxidoreductase [Spirochaetales bacterium]